MFKPGPDASTTTFTPQSDAIKLNAAPKTAKRLAAERNRVAHLSTKYFDNEQAFVNVHLKYGNKEVIAGVKARANLAGLTSPPLRL